LDFAMTQDGQERFDASTRRKTMLRNSWTTVLILLALAALVAVGGCSNPKPEPPGNAIKNELEGAPDWVFKDCRDYWDDDKAEERICAVGSAGSTANIAMARSAAVGRGRTEIARQLNLKVQALLKDYQANVTGGGQFGKAADDEQYVSDTSKQITDMSLAGSRMADSWVSNSGTLYALVELDLETFKKSLAEMQALDAQVRAFVEANAAKAFQDLDKAVAKERGETPQPE